MKSVNIFGALFLMVCSVFAQPSPDTLWTSRFGGTGMDFGYTIRPTSDGGYIVAGETTSFLEHVSDAYLVKLNSAGDLQWQRTYGAVNEYTSNLISAVVQTSDQGYILAGSTIVSNWTYAYVVKTNANGDTVWTRVFWDPHASLDIPARGVLETEDGGCLIAGYAAYSFPAHGYMYLLRLNSMGDTLWTRFMRERESIAYEYCNAIIPVSEGGYAIAGYRYTEGSNNVDALLVKVTETGVVQWWRAYGYENYDAFNGISATADGGYILAGQSYVNSSRDTDVYIVRTNSAGDTLWTRRYGANGADIAKSIQLTNGGYIAAGRTSSYGAGDWDMYLTKLDPNGGQLWNWRHGGTYYDVCESVLRTSDGCYILAGTTQSFGAQNYDVYVVKTGQDASGGICPHVCTEAQFISLGDTVDMCSFQAEDEAHWFRIPFEAGSYRIQLNGFSTQADYDILTFFGCSNPIPTNCWGNAVGSEDFTCDFSGSGELFLEVFVYEGPFGPYWLLVNRIVPTESDQVNLPTEFTLSAYPNPFNPSAHLVFTVPQSSQIRLDIFDISGRLVQTPVNSRADAGRHEIRFDGHVLPSGVYYARMTAGSLIRTQKLVLLK